MTTPFVAVSQRADRRPQALLVSWVRTHPVAAFLAWFFPIGWGIVFSRALFDASIPIEPFLIASTAVGLLLPTLVITRLVEGSSGLEALLRRMLPPRAAIGWYALAFLGVPVLATALATVFSGPPAVTPSALLEGLLINSAVTFATTQLWEETAWTGLVQVRLQARYGALLAAIITAALFTLQHVPLIFSVDASALIILLAFFVLATPFRALQGWLYNRTGSLFLVGLLHAVGDAVAAGSIAGLGFLPRIYSGSSDATLYQFGANALIGIVVIVATRARLGMARSRLA